MSIAVFVILFGVWGCVVWATAVLLSRRTPILEAQPPYWLCAQILIISGPLLAVVLAEVLSSVSGESAVYSALPYTLQSIKTPTLVLPNYIFWVVGLVYVIGLTVSLLFVIIPYFSLTKIAGEKPDHYYLGHPVIITQKVVPPCSIGLAPPKILMPQYLIDDLSKDELELIYAHERAHILFYDQRVYLALLLMKSVFWFHPAIADILNRWSAATELRADSYALAGAHPRTRKIYGKLLIGVLRKKSGGTLPCPSATHHLGNYRSAKMRVKNIMTPNLYEGNMHKKKLGLGAVVLLLGGTLAMGAFAAEGESPDKNAQPLVRVPPMFPADCPINQGKIAASVNIKFDVDKDGNVKNARVTKSDNPCFNKVSLNNVAKWKYEPLPRERKGVETRISFKLSAPAK